MIKKYLLVGALIAPFTLADRANSFEFPDKPPFGELSLLMLVITPTTFGEAKNKLAV